MKRSASKFELPAELSPRAALDYAAIDVALRAPRVAVVVDADSDQWMFNARVAIRQSTLTWGGAGFVLVPHRGGTINPLLLRAIQAYDPDYVATSGRTVAQLEFASPGTLNIAGPDGNALEGARLADVLRRSGDHEVFDGGSDDARNLVIAACNPHRMIVDVDDPNSGWDFDLAVLGDDRPSGMGLTPTRDTPTYSDAPCLAASPRWGGALGLLAAARVGAVQRPEPGVHEEPADDTAVAVASWLQGLSSIAPAELRALIHSPTGVGLSVLPESLGPAWANSRGGLVQASRGSTRLSPAFLVFGDSPDDFALWLILDRLYGAATWLHSDWFASGDNGHGHADLKAIYERQSVGRRGFRVCTLSEPESSRKALVEDLRLAYDASARTSDPVRRGRISDEPLDWPSRGMMTLAARESFSVELPVPVTRDDDGGITLAARPPALAMADTNTQAASEMSWEVDATIEGSTMPIGRGLGGHHLCAPGQDPLHTWIRPSRNGVTWHARRFDLVLSGAPADQQVARPKIRVLGLADWTAAITGQRGYKVQYSAAGLRARVLQRLWGSRATMLEDFAGPWGNVFERFGPVGAPGNKGSSAKFVPGEGAVIAGHGAVLTYAGIAGFWPADTDKGDVRDQVDRLISSRILRRGLALVCSECHKAAFKPLDDLAQSNTCTRCSAVTELTQAAWKTPVDEPLWFYDLHPVARELVQDNGDAPLVAAQRLRMGVSTFTDVAEMELVKDGKPVAETDLLAHMDGEVVTGEVKTGNELHNNRAGRLDAAHKRALWADVIRADRIVLATTQKAWASSSIEAMKSVIESHPWAPGHRPRLSLLTELATSQVQHVEVTM